MNKSLLLLPLLLGVPFAPVANAESCPAASLVNGSEIQLPCVQVGSATYRTTLQPLAGTPLAWQWGGTLEPASCTAVAALCTSVAANLDLTINAITINGATFRAELARAVDLPGVAWRYRSHTAVDGAATSTTLSSAALATLRDYMNQVVGVDKQVPGAVLGIAQGSSVVMAEAFGFSDVSTSAAMNTDNLLHIGSTNKALTSFLIGVLVDEGVLQWDTRAQEIYPAFATANPQTAGTITIRQLLDMSSGLPKEANFEVNEAARMLFEQLPSQPLVGNPGERYQYSNLGTSLAGYLGVLAVAKRDHGAVTDEDLNNLYAGYVALLKSKVLDPIGMGNSFVPIADARATGRMARSHAFENGRFVVSESVEVAEDNSAPSGGLKSTIGDMMRYIITDMRQGLTPEGVRVAGAANVAARQQLSPGPATAEEYGMCLEIKTVNGLRYVGHTGSFDNFNSVMGFFPDKQVAFVLLTNGDSPGALTLTDSGWLEKLAAVLAGS
ncbi:serine hydrolase domain-containing protein [Endothiovibrio diazotrophicus]